MQRFAIFAALALGLAACGGPDYAGGTPDVAGLTLESTGGTTDASTSALRIAGGASAQLVGPACADYEYLCRIQEGVAGLNLYVHATVQPVEDLVANGPRSDPARDVRVYGPLDLAVWNQPQPVATFLLTVRHVRDEIYRWKLEAKPIGSPDGAYLVVLAGQLARGDAPHRGRGVVGIDLDHLALVNPLVFTGQGKLLAGFAQSGAEKALVYGLSRFQPSATGDYVDGAFFVGHRLATGETRVRLAMAKDFVTPNPSSGLADSLELLVARGRWVPNVGGRAAVAVTGPDVQSYDTAAYNAVDPTIPVFPIEFLLGVSCFTPASASTGAEVYRDYLVCTLHPAPGNQSCYPVPAQYLPNQDPGYRTGSPASCAPGTDVLDTPPPLDNEAAPEPGAPLVPEPPPTGVPLF